MSVDFDPQEWKEFLPGIFHHRLDKTRVVFKCIGDPDHHQKERRDVQNQTCNTQSKELLIGPDSKAQIEENDNTAHVTSHACES